MTIRAGLIVIFLLAIGPAAFAETPQPGDPPASSPPPASAKQPVTKKHVLPPGAVSDPAGMKSVQLPASSQADPKKAPAEKVLACPSGTAAAKQGSGC